LLAGTLRTPNLDPLTINVGGNYTQGPGGRLALGIAGINEQDYDHVQVGGNASLNGTLAVSSLNNFRPSAGNAFEILHTNGVRTGEFAQVNDSLNNNPNLQLVDVYAPNGVALVYIAAPPTPGPSPTPKPPINVEDPIPLPPVNPEEPLLPEAPLLSILDPTAEQLTSLYEISFSGANTQRFNLDERFADIQRGLQGSPRIFRFQHHLPVKKQSARQKLLRRYFNPRPRIVGAYGRTVGETGYLSITTAPQRATTSQQAALSSGLTIGSPITSQSASWVAMLTLGPICNHPVTLT
jgi:outer membrane autotransporter protein